MKQYHPDSGSPFLGGTSLLVIFSVLCLAVFSMLTLSTARHEKRLSDNAAKAVSAYYAADTLAEQYFAQLRNGQIPASINKTEDCYTFSIPLSSRQFLQVQVTQTHPGWQILCWQTCVYEGSDTTSPLPVWDGNTTEEVSP